MGPGPIVAHHHLHKWMFGDISLLKRPLSIYKLFMVVTNCLFYLPMLDDFAIEVYLAFENIEIL